MVKQNKKMKDYKLLYLGCILIILIVIAISFSFNPEKKTDDSISASNITTEEQVEEFENENITAKLKKMEERERMEFYFGIFLEHVENDEYEKAYELLYEEFKTNYFPTLESFEEYIEKTFSEMTDIEHENIERNGDVYVLWISITDAINGKPGEEKKMNIVIKENDYNDFVMSFSVI